jgi:phosphoesterase RecJ-like protein
MPIDRADFQAAAQAVSQWRRPLLVTHTRADGDAIGCVAAMRSVLRHGGADPLALLFEPPPDRYAWICGDDPPGVWNVTVQAADLGRVDGVLVMDTCTYSQLSPIADWLRAAHVPKVVVDHHQTRDPLADIFLIEASASAACLILHDWCRAAPWTIDDQTALALFVGVATDTGWFRFSNADARAFEAAADLVRRNLVIDEIYRRIFECESAARVRLMGAALAGLELYYHDRLAVLTVTNEMLARCGAQRSDTENLINEPMKIATVEGSVLLAEDDGGMTRVSFRSKGAVDVAALAVTFGGGGHSRAAGARLAQPLTAAKLEIVKRFGLHAGWSS